MIPKSGYRFSDKIMLKNKQTAMALRNSPPPLANRLLTGVNDNQMRRQ
jgi:hypothetical protein